MPHYGALGAGAPLFGPQQLEADIAVELVEGFLAGMWVVLALAGLSQIARHQDAARRRVDLLLAVLLDEDAGHRRFAGLCWKIFAFPVVAAEPRVEKVA